MTDLPSTVLVPYSRFLEYQDRRRRVVAESARRQEASTNHPVRTSQAPRQAAIDPAVEAGSTLTESNPEADDRRAPGRQQVRAAPPAGRIQGRRRTADATDESSLP